MTFEDPSDGVCTSPLLLELASTLSVRLVSASIRVIDVPWLSSTSTPTKAKQAEIKKLGRVFKNVHIHTQPSLLTYAKSRIFSITPVLQEPQSSRTCYA